MRRGSCLEPGPRWPRSAHRAEWAPTGAAIPGPTRGRLGAIPGPTKAQTSAVVGRQGLQAMLDVGRRRIKPMLRLGTLLLVLRRVLLGGQVGLRRLVLGRELGLPSVVLGREVGLQSLVLGGQVGLQAWTWIFDVFCSDANGGALFLLTDGSVLMNECAGGYGTRAVVDAHSRFDRELRQRKLDARGRQQRRAEVLRIRRARRRQAPCLRRRVQRLERHQLPGRHGRERDLRSGCELLDGRVPALGRDPARRRAVLHARGRAFPARQLQQHLDVPARSRNGKLDDRWRATAPRATAARRRHGC